MEMKPHRYLPTLTEVKVCPVNEDAVIWGDDTMRHIVTLMLFATYFASCHFLSFFPVSLSDAVCDRCHVVLDG